MPLDAICVACMQSELSARLTDGRIDKIYQPERDEITLSVRTPRETVRLLISAGHQNPRIHITEIRKKNPAEAPLFCMLLRKHLAGGKLLDISQPDFERVLRFTAEVYNELGDKTYRYLYAEFAGRNPNIILTDENHKIIEAAHHQDLSSGRGILPGMTYTMPPLQEKENPLTETAEECKMRLLSMPEALAEKALVTLYRGVSPMAARCIVAESLGTDSAPVRENEDKLAAGFIRFFERVRNSAFVPTLLRTPEGETVDFTAYTPSAALDVFATEPMESMSAVLDAFFTRKDQADRMRQKGAGLKKQVSLLLGRLERKMVLHEATLRDTENMELYRMYGELLCANVYRTPQGADSVTLENFYDNMTPVTIPLEKGKAASQNAQTYFKKYHKLKTAARVVEEELARAKSEHAYLETVSDAITRAEDGDALEEIRRELEAGKYIKAEKRGKKQKETPLAPLEFTFDGYTLLVGRNNRQNDLVTFRLSRAEDTWLHVKNMPGSHAILKGSLPVPEDVLYRSAQLAAYFSSGRDSSQVPVDYTKAKHVWKPGGAKPGMVPYEKHLTLYVTPASPEDLV